MEGLPLGRVKLVRFVPDLHKRILYDFLGFLGAAEHAISQGKEGARGVIVELPQGIAIPRRNAAQQRGLCFLCALRHGRYLGQYASRSHQLQRQSNVRLIPAISTLAEDIWMRPSSRSPAS